MCSLKMEATRSLTPKRLVQFRIQVLSFEFCSTSEAGSQQQVHRPPAAREIERACGGQLQDDPSEVGAAAGAHTAKGLAGKRAAGVAPPQEPRIDEGDDLDWQPPVVEIA